MTQNQQTQGKTLEEVFSEILKKQKEADSYTEAMKPVLDKGLDFVLQTILVDKLEEASDTLKMVEADVPEQIQEKIDEKNKIIESIKTEIRQHLDEALEKAELKDWLKFASQCKLDTRMYDEIDTRYQLVYDHIRTQKLQDKKDLRTIQTFIARKTLSIFTEEQKVQIYKMLKAEIPNVKQRTDVILATKFIDNLDVSVKTLMGDHEELFNSVDKKYHPFLEWIVTNVKEYSSYVDETIEQLEEIEMFSLTNARIDKYAENFIVRFNLLDGIEDQKQGQELFTKHFEELKALFKSVYADNYLGI